MTAPERLPMTILSAVMTGVLLFIPTTAEAWYFDWIWELSGPGPSEGGPGVLGTFCLFSNASSRGSTRFDPAPCLYVDRRSVQNDRDGKGGDDDNFPNRVRLEPWDFGVSWRLFNDGLEVGAGIGFIRFQSDDLIAHRGKLARTKFTVNAPRVVVAPIRLLFPGVDNSDWTGALTRLVKVYGRLTIIPGTIDATDFGVPLGMAPGQSTFRERNDVVPSAGLVIDVGEFLLEVLGR
jgi:hypothetical protein